MDEKLQIQNLLSFFYNFNAFSTGLKYDSGYPNVKPDVNVKFIPDNKGLKILTAATDTELFYLLKSDIKSIDIPDDKQETMIVSFSHQENNYKIKFIVTGKNAKQTFVDIKHNLFAFWKISEGKDISADLKTFSEKKLKENNNSMMGCFIVLFFLIIVFLIFFVSNKSNDDKNVDSSLEAEASLAVDSAVVSANESQPEAVKALTSKEIKEMEKKAAIVASESRKRYGDDLRNQFLDRNLNIKVLVSGTDNKKIKLTYVLFDEVWFRKFETEGFFDKLHNEGFTRIELSDGYKYGQGVKYE